MEKTPVSRPDTSSKISHSPGMESTAGMDALLRQSRDVDPKSGQVTVQTQPPLAGQDTNTTSAPHPPVFLEKAECVYSFSATQDDKKIVAYVTGLAIYKEQLLAVDKGNDKTNVFSHAGEFKFDIKLRDPCDVAVSQTGHLYITSRGDSCVQVYSTRGQQVTTMGQGLLEVPWGITLNRQGHVMVCDCFKKSIFTFHAESGRLLNIIPLNMCDLPMFITVNSVNDNIVISDWGNSCLHVLSPTGDHLYQYGDTEGSDVGELRTPCGVCTDSYGHIFIADRDNNRIVALSPQGQFIKYIANKVDGLKNPRALAINPVGQLVVAEQAGKVKTFKYIALKEGHFSEEINRQDPLLQEAYQRACKDGFERVKRARVMLLGHYGAGKTHLRKRLLGKEYDEVKDPITNGIETDYVLVKEGWNSDEADSHGPAISRLLAVNMRKIHEEILASHAEDEAATDAPTSEKEEKPSSKPPGKKSGVNQEDSLTPSLKPPGKLPGISQEETVADASKHEDENTPSTEGQSLVSEEKEREHQPSPGSLSNFKTKESMELPPDVIAHLTESSYDIENPPARLTVWDFGGQSVYYNTHHTFLSSRAIYILVIDMSLALTDRLDDQWHGAEHFSGTTLDFTDYWIDAIHTYATQQNISEDGESSPRIIIACTHKDKYLENVPKEKHEEKINAYFAELRQHIQQKRSGVHVDPRFFAIDNTCQDEDPEISDLRRYVMKIAESQKSWGEKNPIRWIRLEEELQLRRPPEKREKRWIRYEELQKLALEVGMQGGIELKSFLQFHHDIGDLHFQTDDLPDTVILNPLWLIDAFRSIIAVDKHHDKTKGTPYWSALKKGILDERLLDELWGDDSELKPIVIGVMVQFNILLQQDVKPGTTGKLTSRQFYVPSLLQICKNPELGVGSEGTLFIKGKENFMPHVLFNRLTSKLVQNDTSPARKGLRRRGDFFLIKNELYYDYAVYAIDPRRGARCALRKSTKSSCIELIPLYPSETKFDRTIREAYAKWKNHVFMQIQQVKQTVCPHLQLEWCVRNPRKPKVRGELTTINPMESDLTACGLPEDSVYRLWFMPDSSEKEHDVTPPTRSLPSDTGGNRHCGRSQEQRMLELPAPPQPRHSASQANEELGTDALKDTYLRRFSITPEGGHVHLKEVGVFLLVPPGALADTTEMFIGISRREEDMPPLPPCQTRASPVVVCGPHGLTFRKPVFLSFYHCISGTRQRKIGKSCPENLTQNSRMDNPFYIWQSETHLNDPCQWKVLSSDSAVLTNTKCVLIVNQFCKHSLSCDRKRLSALVFGSFQARHVPLLQLMVCCVNDTRDEVENVKTSAMESLQMKMLALEKQFEFLTCENSESKKRESYDVSLSLDGFQTKWNMHEDDCRKKVIKYDKLLNNKTEYITYILTPKMTDELDGLDCKIHIKQEVSEDQEEDIKELTSTELDIHWMLPVAPPIFLYNFGSYSGGPESVRSAPQLSSHPLPGGVRHGGNLFQSGPNQQYYQQDPYQQNQPRIQSNIGNQQDDFQSQTARGVVVQGQNQQNQPTPESVNDTPDEVERSQGSFSGSCSNAEGDRYGNTNVFGKILLSMEYDYKKCCLIIRIYRCQDLAPADVKKNKSDPYVKTYLLPDKSRGGKRKTKIKKNTLNPTFDESLHYIVTKNQLERRILWLSVWHSVKFGHNKLLGEVLLPLNKQNFGDTSPQWFQLSGDHMAAGDRDQAVTNVTDPHSIKTTRGQVLNQADVGNQWQRSTLLETSLEPNFGNQQDDFQSQITRKMVAQEQYHQNQPRIKSTIGNQQDYFQSETARKMVVRGKYQPNPPSSLSNFDNQRLQEGNFQSQTLPGGSIGRYQRYHQEGQLQDSILPQGPITGHRLEEQGGDHFQTRRKSGHEFPYIPQQQDPVATGDQDQSVTDPQTIRTMGNEALNQAHGDNQLERLPTAVTHGVLRQIPANTGNTHITYYNFQQVYNYTGTSDKESMLQMKEKDVTASFNKHVSPKVKKRLNETLSQDDVWDQVKKMYGIPDETPRPPDFVSSLLSQVNGSIASFITVLLKLKEHLREGQRDILQDLIGEVKKGLMSEMEYNKLREKVIDFAEELSIHIERILDHLYQFSIIPDEETTKIKNDAKRNPQEASRDLFKVLLATSPKKEPIKHLKAAFRDFGLCHLADKLEFSYQDVEEELQKQGGSSSEEPLAIGMAAPPTPATGENPIGPH